MICSKQGNELPGFIKGEKISWPPKRQVATQEVLLHGINEWYCSLVQEKSVTQFTETLSKALFNQLIYEFIIAFWEIIWDHIRFTLTAMTVRFLSLSTPVSLYGMWSRHTNWMATQACFLQGRPMTCTVPSLLYAELMRVFARCWLLRHKIEGLSPIICYLAGVFKTLVNSQ